MAQRRMFSLEVANTDIFLDMPGTAQNLYFQLGLRADDDGFIGNPRTVVRYVGAGLDDLKLLIAKGYVIPFDDGAVAITDWLRNNLIRKDRYKKTFYQSDFKRLSVNENNQYCLNDEQLSIQFDNQMVANRQPNGNQLTTEWQPVDNQMTTNRQPNGDFLKKAKTPETLEYQGNTESGNQMTTSWQPNGNQMATQVRLGKVRLGNNTKVSSSKNCDNISSQIIEYLNLKTHSKYQVNSKTTQRLINARLNDGFTLTDFKKVIDNKASEWLSDPYWSNFLRPSTLFGTKFESYLNQKNAKRKNNSFARSSSKPRTYSSTKWQEVAEKQKQRQDKPVMSDEEMMSILRK